MCARINLTGYVLLYTLTLKLCTDCIENKGTQYKIIFMCISENGTRQLSILCKSDQCLLSFASTPCSGIRLCKHLRWIKSCFDLIPSLCSMGVKCSSPIRNIILQNPVYVATISYSSERILSIIVCHKERVILHSGSAHFFLCFFASLEIFFTHSLRNRSEDFVVKRNDCLMSSDNFRY